MKLLPLIMLPLVLFLPHAHPKTLTAADRAREIRLITPKLKQSCVVLRQRVVQWWVEMEESEAIRCLDASYIPQTAFAGVVTGFETDCVNSLLQQAQPQLDGRADLRMSLQPSELQDLFERHYQPVYQRFCAAQNPAASEPAQSPAQENEI